PVDEDFIDVNSAIRAYPDVTSRRLDASGTLEVDGRRIDWNRQEGETPAGRPQGLLVSNSTPLPQEWPEFLDHLLSARRFCSHQGSMRLESWTWQTASEWSVA